MDTCAAVDGCIAAGGRCSCACHVLGNCDCSCGGGLLARCVRTEHAAAMNQAPVKRFPPY